LQNTSDTENYGVVYRYFIEHLEQAAREGAPYTEIISTQAMALPALCDAVLYYNHKIAPTVITHKQQVISRKYYQFYLFIF